MVKEKMTVLLLALSFATISRGDDAPVDRAQALERWIEARLLLSREQQEWRTGRAVLQDRIDLLRGENQALNEKTEAARAEMKKTDGQVAELENRKAELKAGVDGLATSVAGLESRLRDLLGRSPAPIQERVRPLSQRIPTKPEETKLTISERFQNIIGILNEMNKFAREITLASELRELPDGGQSEVTTMYLGFGQAYYCNEKGGVAGVGSPGPDGWIWTARIDLVDAIATAMAIYRNEKPAAYVSLPVRVHHGIPGEDAP